MKKDKVGEAIRWLGTTASIIIHTLFFAGLYLLSFFGINLLYITLFLNTFVSLEAIYLELFIQRSVNKVDRGIEELKRCD